MPYPGNLAEAPWWQSEQATTASSATTTTEIVTDTITVPVVAGRTYEIKFFGNYNSTANGDEATANLRLTNTAGTRLDSTTVYLPASTRVYRGSLFGVFTASSTGDQVFVTTVARANGSGNVTRYGSATAPSSLTVELKD